MLDTCLFLSFPKNLARAENALFLCYRSSRLKVSSNPRRRSYIRRCRCSFAGRGNIWPAAQHSCYVFLLRVGQHRRLIPACIVGRTSVHDGKPVSDSIRTSFHYIQRILKEHIGHYLHSIYTVISMTRQPQFYGLDTPRFVDLVLCNRLAVLPTTESCRRAASRTKQGAA